MHASRSRTGALLIAIAAIVLVSDSFAFGQQDENRGGAPSMTDAQREDVEALVKLVDGAMTGQAAPAGLSLEWHNDFLKALEGNTYVPFTLMGEAAQFTAPAVTMYIRVVSKAAATPAAEKKDDDSEYAFEDVHFIARPQAAAGEPFRLSRAFAVPAGEYDVYVGLQQSGENAEPKATVVKHSLSVPDFWSGELTTSSIILADRVEPLPQAPTEQEQAEQPYTFGTTRVVPALEREFGKNEELSVLFLVYNPALGPDKKPDIVVEYNFHQRTPEGEKYFNKTSPQNFNAQTLPPQFDLSAGHQLVAGQSVPLASFPAGDYRLEMKITDKHAGRTIDRNVTFTVLGS